MSRLSRNLHRRFHTFVAKWTCFRGDSSSSQVKKHIFFRCKMKRKLKYETFLLHYLNYQVQLWWTSKMLTDDRIVIIFVRLLISHKNNAESCNLSILKVICFSGWIKEIQLRTLFLWFSTDVDTDEPDEKSILLYIAHLYKAFPTIPMHPFQHEHDRVSSTSVRSVKKKREILKCFDVR